MAKILLNDILALTSAEIQNTKLKFNIYNGNTDPLDLYKENPEEVNTTWFLWHNADKENRKANRYFSVGQLAICFLRIANDTWLLTTIKNISKVLPVDPEEGGVGYDAQEDKRFEKYFGRLVVKYHNTSMAMGKKYGSVMDELEVLELLNDQFTGDEFPGYENVRLTYRQLKTVIDRQLPGWIAALQNTKAVYLITDTSNGLLYVGSATAQDGMLLQRWSSYVANGHGGNVDLKRIVQEKGFTYVQTCFHVRHKDFKRKQGLDIFLLISENISFLCVIQIIVDHTPNGSLTRARNRRDNFNRMLTVKDVIDTIPAANFYWIDLVQETRAYVLDRNGFTCQMCGAVAGEPHPYDPTRKTRLHIGHIIDKSMGRTDDPANLRAICSVCNEGASNLTLDRPSYEKLLIQIRRATGGDQLKVLEWLVKKFPDQTKKLVKNENAN